MLPEDTEKQLLVYQRNKITEYHVEWGRPNPFIRGEPVGEIDCKCVWRPLIRQALKGIKS